MATASPQKSDDPAAQACVGWTTLPTREDAERLATGVVEARLAACAQIDGPIVSCYHWEGKLCRDTEWRVTVKFLSKNTGVVEKWIHENHPYDTPQWIAVLAHRVSPGYFSWMTTSTFPP